MIGWLDGWLIGWMVGWLVEWLVDWLNGWLVSRWLVVWLTGWLVGCLVDWLVGWLVGWLVVDGCLVDGLVSWLPGWLTGWSVDWLVGWLVGRLVDWLLVWLVGAPLGRLAFDARTGSMSKVLQKLVQSRDRRLSRHWQPVVEAVTCSVTFVFTWFDPVTFFCQDNYSTWYTCKSCDFPQNIINISLVMNRSEQPVYPLYTVQICSVSCWSIRSRMWQSARWRTVLQFGDRCQSFSLSFTLRCKVYGMWK